MHNLNATRFPTLISHTPAGTSVKNMAHWAQMLRSNKWEMFDYGSAAANVAKYGSPSPPLYNYSSMAQKIPMK
jgi:hypothetical protein